MTNLDIWLLAVGLAMDCFAVSIASGIIMQRIRLRLMLSMAFAFGFFQALMPLIGWIGASFFSHLIEDIDHWIAFAILAFLGGRMVREAFKDEDCRHEFDPANLKVLLTLAVATSIDALPWVSPLPSWALTASPQSFRLLALSVWFRLSSRLLGCCSEYASATALHASSGRNSGAASYS